MKRNFVVACALALALVLGLSATVGASVEGSTEPAAKKGAKKGKGCKGKTGKGKAGKSAAASAKKKGKSKGCKGEGKASLRLTDGAYQDPGANSVALTISGGGTLAQVGFSGDSTCFPLLLTGEPVPVTATATSLRANGTIDGGYFSGKWSITVTSSLKYELVTDSSYNFQEQDPCNKPGVKFTGTLVKAS